MENIFQKKKQTNITKETFKFLYLRLNLKFIKKYLKSVKQNLFVFGLTCPTCQTDFLRNIPTYSTSTKEYYSLYFFSIGCLVHIVFPIF